MLRYCLRAPAVLYGDVVDSIDVYDEHGAMAGGGTLAIDTRMVELDYKSHSFESDLLKL